MTGQNLTLVRVWDLRNRRELFSEQAEGPTAFSADGLLVAAGGRVWEAATGREVARVRSPIVAFSPDSSYVITRSRGDRFMDMAANGSHFGGLRHDPRHVVDG